MGASTCAPTAAPTIAFDLCDNNDWLLLNHFTLVELRRHRRPGIWFPLVVGRCAGAFEREGAVEPFEGKLNWPLVPLDERLVEGEQLARENRMHTKGTGHA